MKQNKLGRFRSEIHHTFKNITVTTSGVKAGIVYLISYLILVTIGVPVSYVFAIIPAAIYFHKIYNNKKKTNAYSIIEEKFPELKDKLKTARDNLDDENIFVRSLHQEVTKELNQVPTSLFLDHKKTRNDIILLAVLAIIIIAIAPFNIQFIKIKFNPEDFRLDLEGTDLLKAMAFGGDEEGGGGEGAGGGVNEDIFGEKSIALLGDEDLEVMLSLSNNEIDVSNVKEVEEIQFKSTYPDEIGATAASSFEGDIPKEQQELIKNYYKKIAEEG